MIRVDVVEQKILVDLSSRDEGRCHGTKILVDLSSRDDGVCLGNNKFLCTCHHVMRVDVVEQSILMDLSSCDDGVCLGSRKMLCTCHQVMRLYILGTKKSCAFVIM